MIRFSYTSGQTKAAEAGEKIADLPASDAALDQDTATRLKIDISQTRGYNHWTRNVIVDPAGRSCTSRSDRRPTRRRRMPPTASRAAPSTNTTSMAAATACSPTGLRNPVGLAYFPGSTTLWTAVNERDHLGDDLVPDYITSVRDGGFYGWPYSYLGHHVDPTVEPQRPDLVAKAIAPDVLLTSHAAALGLLFYTGSQFPPAYRNSAFVRPARLDQPLEALRLPCRPRAVPRRPAGRIAGRLPQRLRRAR